MEAAEGQELEFDLLAGRSTVVPTHSGETIGPGFLHKTFRNCQITFEQLSDLL